MPEQIPASELLLTYNDLAARWGRTAAALRVASHRGNIPAPDYYIDEKPVWTEKTIRDAERVNPSLKKR
jgi:hypothetical protein